LLLKKYCNTFFKCIYKIYFEAQIGTTGTKKVEQVLRDKQKKMSHTQ